MSKKNQNFQTYQNNHFFKKLSDFFFVFNKKKKKKSLCFPLLEIQDST